MPDRKPIAHLRRQILDRAGVTMQKHTRKLIPIENTPDVFPKTPKMKYLETKYKCKIESIIFRWSLDDVVMYFRQEVDRSTISRWRKYVRGYLGKVDVRE